MIRKRSVAIELRLRAEAEARREAREKLKMILVRSVPDDITEIARTFTIKGNLNYIPIHNTFLIAFISYYW